MDIGIRQHWHVECVRPDGSIRWVDEGDNLITNEGLAHILDKFYKGSAYTTSLHVGLIDLTGYTAIANDDTYADITDATPAGADNTWQEFTNYDENRVVPTLGSITGTTTASVDNVASKAVFTISAGGGTVKGAFLTEAGIATKGDDAQAGAKLIGARLFSGDRVVLQADVLNVTVTLTATDNGA